MNDSLMEHLQLYKSGSQQSMLEHRVEEIFRVTQSPNCIKLEEEAEKFKIH